MLLHSDKKHVDGLNVLRLSSSLTCSQQQSLSLQPGHTMQNDYDLHCSLFGRYFFTYYPDK